MDAGHLPGAMAERADVAERLAQAALDEGRLVGQGTEGPGQALLEPEGHAPLWLIPCHAVYSIMLYASHERKADRTSNRRGRAI